MSVRQQHAAEQLEEPWDAVMLELARIRAFSQTELGRLLGCQAQCHEETVNRASGGSSIRRAGCPHRDTCLAAVALNTALVAVGVSCSDPRHSRRYAHHYVDEAGIRHYTVRKVS